VYVLFFPSKCIKSVACSFGRTMDKQVRNTVDMAFLVSHTTGVVYMIGSSLAYSHYAGVVAGPSALDQITPAERDQLSKILVVPS
jgi:predicted PurR-regulated permease PerM